MDTVQLWRAALLHALRAGAIKSSDAITFLRGSTLQGVDAGVATVAVPSAFYQSNVQSRCAPAVAAALAAVGYEVSTVDVVVDASLHAKDPRAVDVPALMREAAAEAPATDAEEAIGPDAPVRPTADDLSDNGPTGHTFDTFIVSDESSLAFAAAQAVAKRPGKAYNPLFIYGGVGLGKTHLLHAIRNAVVKADKTREVAYVSSEKFYTDFIAAIRTGRADEIRKRYRKVDALIIDDVQFFAGKDASQVEFFHLFNALHDEGKQIVIAADRPPSELKGIDPRLGTRFAQGMTVDVHLPSLEARVAILQRRLREKQLHMDAAVVELIAANAQTNVREMLGILTQVMADYELTGRIPTLKSAVTILQRAYPRQKLVGLPDDMITVLPSEVLAAAAQALGVAAEDITGKSRQADIALARQLTAYACKQGLGMKLADIGQVLGGKDHSTVLHSITKIEQLVASSDARVQGLLQAMGKELGLGGKLAK